MNRKIKKIVYRNLDTRYRHYYQLKKLTRKKSNLEKIILLILINIFVWFPAYCLLSQKSHIVIHNPYTMIAEAATTDPICDLEVVECDFEPKKELTPAYPRQAIGTTYNAEVGQTDSDPFTMANGKRVNESAVASNCYPLGTKIEVQDMGIYTVEDRMNSRYTADCGTDHERIDFFKFSRKDNFRKIVKYRTL